MVVLLAFFASFTHVTPSAKGRGLEAVLTFILINKTYLGALLGGLLVALLVTPFVIRLAKRFAIVDHPGARAVHRQVTPLMGGLAVYAGTWLPILPLLFWRNDITQKLAESGRWEDYAWMALMGGVMLFLGVIDDARGVGAKKKLLVQLVLAIPFALWVGHFGNVVIPGFDTIELGNLGYVLTVLWIIGVTNAVNLIDGLDGLATGVTLVVALSNAVLAIIWGNYFLALILMSMAGACLGFLRYNFNPARIFLGDTGSLFLGMTLATGSILASQKTPIATSFLVAIIIMGYPIADTLLAMLRRALQGRPIMSADRGHIHHRLMAHGFGHRGSAAVIYGFSLALSLLAISIVLNDNILMVAMLIIVLVIGSLGLHIIGYFRPFAPKTLKTHRTLYRVAFHLGGLLRARLQIASETEERFDIIREAAEQFGALRLVILLDDTVYPDVEPQYYEWRHPMLGGEPSATEDVKTLSPPPALIAESAEGPPPRVSTQAVTALPTSSLPGLDPMAETAAIPALPRRAHTATIKTSAGTALPPPIRLPQRTGRDTASLRFYPTPGMSVRLEWLAANPVPEDVMVEYRRQIALLLDDLAEVLPSPRPRTSRRVSIVDRTLPDLPHAAAWDEAPPTTSEAQ